VKQRSKHFNEYGSGHDLRLKVKLERISICFSFSNNQTEILYLKTKNKLAIFISLKYTAHCEYQLRLDIFLRIPTMFCCHVMALL